MKHRLIGSAASLTTLTELLIKKWCWNTVYFEFTENPKIMRVINNGRVIDGLRIKILKNRFRLEDKNV